MAMECRSKCTHIAMPAWMRYVGTCCLREGAITYVSTLPKQYYCKCGCSGRHTLNTLLNVLKWDLGNLFKGYITPPYTAIVAPARRDYGVQLFFLRPGVIGVGTVWRSTSDIMQTSNIARDADHNHLKRKFFNEALGSIAGGSNRDTERGSS